MATFLSSHLSYCGFLHGNERIRYAQIKVFYNKNDAEPNYMAIGILRNNHLMVFSLMQYYVLFVFRPYISLIPFWLKAFATLYSVHYLIRATHYSLLKVLCKSLSIRLLFVRHVQFAKAFSKAVLHKSNHSFLFPMLLSSDLPMRLHFVSYLPKLN